MQIPGIQSVLFSFSGHRGSGKTTIFQEVERLAQERHPGQPLAFLGNVLDSVSHPLLWSDDERTLHATTRLLRRWSDLNEACFKVRAHLDRGNDVVVDEFGLDVYLDAIACKTCREQKHEAFQLHHHHLVPARIITQGIRPPIYFIPRTWQESGEEVAQFHLATEREIERYFDNTGQNPPIYLEGKTVTECAEEALEHILTKRANRRSLSA